MVETFTTIMPHRFPFSAARHSLLNYPKTKISIAE